MAASLGHQRAFTATRCQSSRASSRRVATSRLAPAMQPRTSHKVRAIELDFSDPDTQLSVAGLVLGLVFGLGAPAWYINRTERDEERLEELRAINRATYQETGEYMSDDEIAKIRKPKWTDRREFVDDD
eukprot:GHUV01001947.1.p2 GENE.GHUV01001947.1~~GHUV01001947.1.p2  ORF type:complete len:129 (+),score=16.54 GHUV01001947.1:104-490(+)